jgi:hypothetical protein
MRKILFVLLATIFCNVTYCQDTKVVVGFEMTPTIISLRENSSVFDYDPSPGYSIGLSFEYFMSDQFSLKSGLAYEMKGAESDIFLTDNYGNPSGTDILIFHYNYLTLPVMGSFSTKGKVKFYINAGPYFGFLINQKLKSSLENTDITNQSKRLDFGLSCGLGLNIPIGKKLLLDLGLRENLGLKNISDLNYNYDSRIATNSFGLLIGLKYKL